ncbi:MAG: hypothetical protein WBN87_12985 [Thermoanaerobaculia bacterium]
MKTPRRIPAVVLLPLMAILAVPACSGQSSPESQPTPLSFAVYALSIGKGVPEEARNALEEARNILEEDREQGVHLEIFETVLGLEGERRVCAVYDDSEASESAFTRISDLIEGIELINLVREDCESAPNPPTPEEKEV